MNNFIKIKNEMDETIVLNTNHIYKIISSVDGCAIWIGRLMHPTKTKIKIDKLLKLIGGDNASKTCLHNTCKKGI